MGYVMKIKYLIVLIILVFVISGFILIVTNNTSIGLWLVIIGWIGARTMEVVCK